MPALPEPGAVPVGYAYLIGRYGLKVPVPSVLSAIGKRHARYESGAWRVYTPRHAPKSGLYGHLVFALRYEGVDLSVLGALFGQIQESEIEELGSVIRGEPSGRYSRRIWFLFEHLTGSVLDVPDISERTYVDLLDPRMQYAASPRPSKRHCVNNNLPGLPNFCPLVRRTEKLDALTERDLSKAAVDLIGDIHPDVLTRAASFLLLEDSKASYAIEGESPPRDREERWARIIGQAGRTPLSRTELERLQDEVIVDSRFMRMGYRKEGGFIGQRHRSTRMPLPVHISARPEDLDVLMEGLMETAALLVEDAGFPPVLAAALVGFGFVFIHPFEDGNGRLHRYLLHHVLIESGFTPKELVFPVSAVILRRINEYKNALEAYSKPRLHLVEWRATETGNVEVLNDTLDLYRYFDATPQAEFFYECVEETITKTLPDEIRFLVRYDEMKIFIENYIDMPDRTVSLLVGFLHQNDGRLSRRAKAKEFAALTDEEVHAIEAKYSEIFRS